jgi:hypothetical protein
LIGFIVAWKQRSHQIQLGHDSSTSKNIDWGVIVGAVIIGYLPERIRFISDARLLVFGIVLVIVMNFRPDGLLPRKKREKAIVKKGVNK